MKKYHVAILFTQPPFGSSASREGLDTLLALTAFCEEDEIAICFLNDGIFNLYVSQQPDLILQKDHISTFKLIDLYELPHCFICRDSFEKCGISSQEWVLSHPNIVSEKEMFDILNHAEKVLTF